MFLNFQAGHKALELSSNFTNGIVYVLFNTQQQYINLSWLSGEKERERNKNEGRDGKFQNTKPNFGAFKT